MTSIRRFFIVFLLPNIFVNSVPLNTLKDDSLTKSVPEIIASNFDDIQKSTSEMIAEEGYPVETHWVTTPDGYILCMHRIPTGRNGETNGKVSFLLHGLTSSSSDFVLFGPGKSLAYMLADEGYDVWMANARGNIYSRNHTTYNPDKDANFWEFTWNEIGEIDLPTLIDYILDKTGVDGVYFAGHSQGTTSFYVMASEKPEYNQKIKVQASLAPVAYMEHMKSPLSRLMVLFQDSIGFLIKVLGIHEFPGTGIMHDFLVALCSLEPLVCQNYIFVTCGFSFDEMNLTAIPLIMGHYPAGAAVKQLTHYGQGISNGGKFRKFDYGLIENLEKYGSMSPPDYDVSKVTAPVYFIYSKNDWFAAMEDVEKLYGEIGNPVGKMIVDDDTFNHADYVYGVHAPELVYHNILNLFEKY